MALCAALLFGGTAHAGKPAPPPTTSGKNPIVFVHGWNSSGTVWNTMISRFSADGWTSAELNNWSYNTSQSNATTASQLSTKIDDVLKRTGAAKVDVITHSMGGLSSRYYAKNLGGDLKIDAGCRSAGRTTAPTSPAAARGRPPARRCASAPPSWPR